MISPYWCEVTTSVIQIHLFSFVCSFVCYDVTTAISFSASLLLFCFSVLRVLHFISDGGLGAITHGMDNLGFFVSLLDNPSPSIYLLMMEKPIWRTGGWSWSLLCLFGFSSDWAGLVACGWIGWMDGTVAYGCIHGMVQGGFTGHSFRTLISLVCCFCRSLES